jgi:lipid-binding SYLF domain-containing protein
MEEFMNKRSIIVLAAALLFLANSALIAQKSKEIDQKVDAAMAQLTSSTPSAAELAKTAKGILMFPSVKKGGFIVGGQYGEGSLRVGGRTEGYYKTTAASFGLQAGGEKFGYAMFFMNDNGLNYLRNSKGWEIGVGPEVTVVDAGAAASLSTSTARSDIYVFFFGQKGLMGGLTIQGSKITKFENIDK